MEILNATWQKNISRSEIINNPTFKITLNIKNLYNTAKEIDGFWLRWQQFKRACSPWEVIFDEFGNTISYYSHNVLVKPIPSRRSCFLILGNPAPHSVYERIPFAYESKKGTHRFWKGISLSGFLNEDFFSVEDLFSGNYKSNYLINLYSFYSLPTPSSSFYSGVAGIKKLFGSKAFRILSEMEKMRFQQTIQSYAHANALVIIFQKDAYSTINPDIPLYSLKDAFEGKLHFKSQIANYPLDYFGVPPTRLIITHKSLNILSTIARCFSPSISDDTP